MAVQVFKDGKSILVEPEALSRHIAVGWSVDDPVLESTPAIIPQTLFPAHLSHLPEQEAEIAVLKEMGIEVVHPAPKKRGWPKGKPRKKVASA